MSAETQFWKWFLHHEEELFHFERDQERIFDHLAEALCKVDSDLTFEFGPDHESVREFVISAGGITEAFPAVQQLYDARPHLQHFFVTAFRPRRAVINNIEFADVTINADEVNYRLCKDSDPSRVGILLFLLGYCKDRSTEFRQVGYLFLDEALGEYDVETKVGFIEIMGHESKYFEGAFPIQELANDFDTVIASKGATSA